MTPDEACKLLQDLDNHYGYIYCLTFPNGKRYVGQSTRPWTVRWCSHRNNTGCTLLKRALNKYPIEQIKWELLEYTQDKVSTDSREQFYISSLGTLAPTGYNLTHGGTCPPITVLINNPELTEEQKKDIIKARQYNKYAREYQDRGFNVMSYLTANKDYVYLTAGEYIGRIKAAESYKDPIKGAYIRNKLHEKQKALRSRPIYCEETKETFSCTKEAVEKHPEWNKDKINWCCAKHNKTHLGLHFRYADLTKQEIEEVNNYWKKEVYTVTAGTYAAKAVYCIETDKIYPSTAQASRELNIERTHISDVCKRKRKSVGGYHFTYALESSLIETPTASQDPL